MTDGARTVEAIPKMEGKRMTRRQMFDRRKPSRPVAVVKAITPRQKERDQEMRMSADEFDDIMKKVLTTPVDVDDEDNNG